MEAPLHHSPVPLLSTLPSSAPPPPPHQLQQHDAISAACFLRQHATAMMIQRPPAPAGGAGATTAAEPPQQQRRERCPRCASRDTKFCYYNNYNTAQPRHFCRACRRYWTLGGSLRDVPVGGSTRRHKRPRLARSATTTATSTTNSSCAGPFAASPVLGFSSSPAPAHQTGAGFLGSMLLGSSAAPLLEGRLGFDLELGRQQTSAGDLAQLLGFSPGPLLWPATTVLEGDRAAETAWKAADGGVVLPPPAAALWPELVAGGLHHGAPHLLL